MLLGFKVQNNGTWTKMKILKRSQTGKRDWILSFLHPWYKHLFVDVNVDVSQSTIILTSDVFLLIICLSGTSDISPEDQSAVSWVMFCFTLSPGWPNLHGCFPPGWGTCMYQSATCRAEIRKNTCLSLRKKDKICGPLQLWKCLYQLRAT